MAKTVLVVDDDPTQRRLMQAAAEKQGFRARVVENGEKALEEASDAKNGVDVVLLDLVMPGLSGMGTVALARPSSPTVLVRVALVLPLSLTTEKDTRQPGWALRASALTLPPGFASVLLTTVFSSLPGG